MLFMPLILINIVQPFFVEAKAFDKHGHSPLLDILCNIGLERNAFIWFYNYLLKT